MNETVGEYDLPLSLVIFSIVFLAVDIVFGFLTNFLLLVTIYSSAHLRTPPNFHLVNISVSNLILCLSLVFSLVTVSARPEAISAMKTLTSIQLFIVSNCSLQYMSAFASIGIYRNITMNKLAMCLKARKRIVSRSIVCSWVISFLLSLVFGLSHMRNDHILCDTLNPFQRSFQDCSEPSAFAAEQITVVLLVIVCYFIGFVIVFRSYYTICKTLNISGIFRRSKIAPWNRTQRLSSESTSEITSARQYSPEEMSHSSKPFTLSDSLCEFVVHYQKNEHMLAFEDIFALENPMLAARLQKKLSEKKPLGPTLSNTSTTTTRSRAACNFTDISPDADLQRIQNMKNASALRNQSLRRDRLSLTSATKNSMIMFFAYIICSVPFIICSIPGVLQNLDGKARIIVLVFCRLLFCLNACVYPTWYLIFSKRVRKCLFRVFDTALLKLHLRR
ncbi:hypothetical protein FSP39_005464 [Pinctada imbricata]|uniref:G-protein coupled receptors family 1 profile domain-containing protein n=1 Tax=Pinctada imbricata TaxID=66713 RepID=A0AA88XMM6_PINIB|nr:hypothetical protein FSP39_005464 [Pinctada imbricata]